MDLGNLLGGIDTDAIAEQERKPILLSDPALKSICRRYGLTAF